MPIREWLLLAILAGIQFAHILDFVIIMPLGPQFMRVFGISAQEFGFMVSSYTFSAAICGFLGSFFIDRFDRKTLLLTLLGGFTVGTLLCAIAPNFTFLIGARVVAGAFGGTMNAAVFAIIGDLFHESRRGTATGTVMSAFSVASIAGVPFGLYLANHFGWQTPFILLTVLSVMIFVIALRSLPAMKSHMVETTALDARETLKFMVGNTNHITAFALIISLMFAAFSVIPYLSPYLVSNVGLTESDLPYVYLVGGACTLFTSRLIGKIADRVGKPQVFTALAAASILPILVLTNLPPVSTVSAVAVSAFFTILISGRAIPAMSMITSSVISRYRGRFMSLTSSVQQLSSGFAALLAGAIIGKTEAGALTHYRSVGLLAVVATVLAIYLGRRLRAAQE